MKKLHGFTLIELTVAIVILGILATLTANAYVSMMERGRWAEAREILLKSYAGFQRSLDDGTPVVAADIGAGTFWTHLGLSDPNTMVGRRLTYTPSGPVLQIVAERLPAGSGNTWTMILSTGVVVRGGNAPIF